MKRTRKILLLALLTIVGVVALMASFLAYSMFYGRPVPPAKPGTITVACVGDSITYGDLLFAGKRYPQQLGELLGDAYSVRNFGAPGFTAQKDGDHPYREHRYFRLSSEFAPDIVVIMLGSNDSKPQNWTGVARFSRDHRALIQHYQSLPGKPRIILATPPSTFLVRGRSALPAGISAAAIAEIAESVKQTGAALGLAVVDVHAATAPHPEFFALDGIHPDGAGAQLIARAVYEELSGGKRKGTH